MKRAVSKENPFGFNDKGFLWEIAKERCPGRHLDYGTYDGAVPRKLKEAGLIEHAVGVDLNAEVVNQNQDSLVTLLAIEKHHELPFENEAFDSMSLLGVIEHVHDQKKLLKQLHRVLKADGWMIVSAPGKHMFSWLDVGNWKFLFPRLHRFYYSKKFSPEAYQERYVECKNGLFGDIETEKMWHQHFKHHELKMLLESCGFEISESDGMGFFMRLLMILGTSKMRWLDAYCFQSAELFVLAKKKREAT